VFSNNQHAIPKKIHTAPLGIGSKTQELLSFLSARARTQARGTITVLHRVHTVVRCHFTFKFFDDSPRLTAGLCL
jgi:hypothetical protein